MTLRKKRKKRVRKMRIIRRQEWLVDKDPLSNRSPKT